MKPLIDQTEPELAATMTGAAGAAKASLPPGTGFAILAWDESGIAQYIANRRREDMVKMLRETADRIEKRCDTPRSPDG